MNIKTLALLAATAPVMANAETLVFASTNPEPVPLNRHFEQWVEKVNADANGALEIDLRHGPTLANHTNFYDRVVDGVVDISWGLSVFNPGKFTNSLTMSIPFFVESSEQGAVAACNLWKSGAFGAEYDGLRPLLFVQFPQASLHTADTPIEGLETMEGMTVIASSPSQVQITKGNGGTPISVTITEVYETVQRGAAEGFMNSFTAFPAFKLGDVLKHHHVTRLGGALGFVFMTEENYNSLSDDAKAAIDANSTCEASRAAGKFIDEWNASALQKLIDDPEHTVTYMPDDVYEAILAEHGGAILEAYAENFPGGQPLVDALMAALDEAK